MILLFLKFPGEYMDQKITQKVKQINSYDDLLLAAKIDLQKINKIMNGPLYKVGTVIIDTEMRENIQKDLKIAIKLAEEGAKEDFGKYEKIFVFYQRYSEEVKDLRVGSIKNIIQKRAKEVKLFCDLIQRNEQKNIGKHVNEKADISYVKKVEKKLQTERKEREKQGDVLKDLKREIDQLKASYTPVFQPPIYPIAIAQVSYVAQVQWELPYNQGQLLQILKQDAHNDNGYWKAGYNWEGRWFEGWVRPENFQFQGEPHVPHHSNHPVN